MTFEELRSLLEAFGFEIASVSGSHYTFRRMLGGIPLKLVIPYRRPHVKAVYVKNALALINEILEALDSDGDDG